MGPDHEAPVPTSGLGHADPVDGSTGLEAVGLARRPCLPGGGQGQEARGHDRHPREPTRPSTLHPSLHGKPPLVFERLSVLSLQQQSVGSDAVEELQVQPTDAVGSFAEASHLGAAGEAAPRLLDQDHVAHGEVQGGHHVGPALADVVGHRQLLLQHHPPLVHLLQREVHEQAQPRVQPAILAVGSFGDHLRFRGGRVGAHRRAAHRRM